MEVLVARFDTTRWKNLVHCFGGEWHLKKVFAPAAARVHSCNSFMRGFAWSLAFNATKMLQQTDFDKTETKWQASSIQSDSEKFRVKRDIR